MYGTELIKAIGTNKLDKLTPYEMDTGENRRIPTELFPSMINSWNDDGGVTDANAFTIAELQIATQSMKRTLERVVAVTLAHNSFEIIWPGALHLHTLERVVAVTLAHNSFEIIWPGALHLHIITYLAGKASSAK
ncbi:hypothetical protein QE152_g33973 [Popillia japonica]|uniref:Uncharacterized protein n=1 Tax=Popillia japonica TaxID=7064 RepID=A0AAW1IUZ2_POPJA